MSLNALYEPHTHSVWMFPLKTYTQTNSNVRSKYKVTYQLGFLLQLCLSSYIQICPILGPSLNNSYLLSGWHVTTGSVASWGLRDMKYIYPHNLTSLDAYNMFIMYQTFIDSNGIL